MESERMKTRDSWDVIVVGAGFAGLYMLYRLKQLAFEAGLRAGMAFGKGL